MFSCVCHIALYTCSTIDSLLSNSINARERKRPFTSNDDDVIKNYVTDMDLGEDSDSLTISGDLLDDLSDWYGKDRLNCMRLL